MIVKVSPKPPAITVRPRETRWLVQGEDDIANLYAGLAAQSTAQNLYNVNTVYLDTPEGTWSVGRMAGLRLRFRAYDGRDVGWFETKTQAKGILTKRRQKFARADLGLLKPLVPILTMDYTRTSYTYPAALRVTVDYGLTNGVDTLPGVVVEAKTTVQQADIPDWLRRLLGKPDKKFDKSTWGLGL